MTGQPFEFGVVTTGTPSRKEWLDLARQAEDLGFDSLLITDHVDQGLAPLTALAAAVAVTSDIRLGTYVLGCDFRHPVQLAKEIATLDLLSEHRVFLGLGAGWLMDDYRSCGLAYLPGQARLNRLAEVLEILRALLGAGCCSFHGEHFEVEIEGFAPALPAMPRLLVGGGGRKALALAARLADVVSILPRSIPGGALDDADATPDRLDQKVRWVREAAGPRGRELVLNHVLWECMITPRPEPILETFARALDLSVADVRQVPSMLVGTAESAAQILLERRARWGLSLVTIPAAAMRQFAPVAASLRGT